jgi:hypothetical protein
MLTGWKYFSKGAKRDEIEEGGGKSVSLGNGGTEPFSE